MAIITTAQYKTYAGISGSSLDAQLDVVIPAVQDELERACGARKFDYAASQVEYLDGTDSPSVLPKRYIPIVAVSSLLVVDVAGNTVYTYPSTAYRFDSTEAGVINLQTVGDAVYTVDDRAGAGPWADRFVYPAAFPRGQRNVKITYSGGYGGAGAITMPPALQMAMYRLVDARMASIRRDPTLGGETLGQYSYTAGVSVRAGLDAYSALLVSVAAPWIRRAQ